MAFINSEWKRGSVISCSHGHLADPHKLRTALKMAKDHKATTRVHLGDFIDMAAFRGGAHGTADEAADIKVDLRAGLRFLEEYRPTILLNGNHEDRLLRDLYSPNAIRSHAATCILTEIKDLAGKMKCQYVEDYDINRSWVTLGDTRLLHGFMYSQNAMMEHAEHFGTCIIGHLHIKGDIPGRRSDHPHCYCVGTLANIPAMAYAKARRATARWSGGIALIEYNDKHCHVDLHEIRESLEA